MQFTPRFSLLALTPALFITTLACARAAWDDVSPPPAPLQPPIYLSAPPVAPANNRPQVDIAICLDISGSMEGLIDSAKARLWSIVNDLALAKPTPSLRVALLTFGCDAYDSASGWVVVDSDLTEDLDLISQKLFALRTNGGTEFVGRVVDKAARSLAWSASADSLRIILVAGNEGADQDHEVTYQTACRGSIEKGIIVNSIYCGSAVDPIAVAWADVAKVADGQFLCIDQSTGAQVASTPFDKALGELSTSINTTYLPTGEKGRAAWANQTEQDRNAAGLGGGVAAQRCATKGGDVYDNSSWDLVDGCAQGTLKLEELKDEDLPKELQGKTLAEKKALVATKQAERTKIQGEIQALQAKREAFLIEEAKKNATATGATLDDALRGAIRSQAQKKNFSWAPAVAP